MMKNVPTLAGRGPHDHSARDQIFDAAMAYFDRCGHEKTAVTDLAKAMGFSKVYIYKSSDSKQAIGEAIYASWLEKIMVVANAAITDAPFASERLRRLFRVLTEAGSELSFGDHKPYDIAIVATHDKWPSTERYAGHLQQLIDQILVEGHQAGEFERRTPLDEVTLAVYMVIRPSINPVQLQYNLDTMPTAAVLPASLILRSPSP